MFKKIKANKFQIGNDHFFTTVPTWYFEMYNMNIGLNFVKQFDAQGRVAFYENDATLLITICDKKSEGTIIHEAVHVKQFIAEHWGTVFDAETEAIIIEKVTLFIQKEWDKYKKTKTKKKR